MKKLVLGGLAALLLLSPLGAQTFIDKPVATVNLLKTEVISGKRLAKDMALYEKNLGRSLNQDEKVEFLESLISQTLVLQAAERDEVRVSTEEAFQAAKMVVVRERRQNVSDQEFSRIVEAQGGGTVDDYVEIIRKQLTIEKYITERKREKIMAILAPSPQEVENFYRQNEQQFSNPDMVKFKHIFFSTQEGADREKKRNLAKEVHQKLVKGEAEFADLVRQYSDDKQSIPREGSLGTYIGRNEQAILLFGSDFVSALFALPVDQLSRVMESNQGFHIVLVEERYKKRFLDLDDPVSPMEAMTVRQYITQYLGGQKQAQAFQQATEETLKELTEEATVQRFPENIQ